MDSSTWSDVQALAYIASYSDLRRVFGTDLAAARQHYAMAGADEGRTISFDPYGYLATYADMRTTFGADVAAATRHFILYGANEGRTVAFDVYGYLATHADLRAVYGADIAAATRHYALYGATEGRAIAFDAYGYLATYADLRGVYGADTAAATRHFALYGAAEGRKIAFDAYGYLATHSDLRAAFGTDTAAATRHFVLYGAAEGRTIAFDALGYIASYSDLRAVFGTDVAAATRHFVHAGAAEGRVVSFDRVAYLLSQSDLIAAGYNADSAIRHWILYGANEGRTAFGAFGTDQSSHSLSLSGTVAGAIDRAGDKDWFKIDLAAGKGVSFDFFPSNGNGVVTIHDANGKIWAPLESVGARTSFIAPHAGSFYVVVSTGNSATGTYTLVANDTLTITGTTGNDTLTGTDGADTIRGMEGVDTLQGRGGNDVLEGGGAYDTLNGGLGDDILYGNNAANTGFDGGDYLIDNEGGNDQLFGQDGNDFLYVSRSAYPNIAASSVLLEGGSGDDTITFYASGRFIDTVTINGGIGNDTISIGTVLRSVINAGDGNDSVLITTVGGDQRITLGAGADVLTLDGSNMNAFAIGSPIVVTDFLVGSDIIVFDQYLTSTLINWTSTSNPFATGHLKLLQAGSDTLIQLDRDGSAGSAYNFATLLTLSGTTASAFTARELGYAPDGSPAPGQVITGTGGNDTLTGSDGADTIRGLDGDDSLNGRGGNDVLEGGSGYDRLNGGLGDDILYGNNAANSGFDLGDYLVDDQGGDDQLFGQDGSDNLSVSRIGSTISDSTVLLDGGSGDDMISFGAFNRFSDIVTIRGGTGNDTISVGTVRRVAVDAGDGNDKVTIGTSGGNQTITLGAGADLLTLQVNGGPLAVGAPIRVTDLQSGTDSIDLDQYLVSALANWDRTSNPFGTGHLKLVQSGTETLLQIDQDGAAGSNYALTTLLTLWNSNAASFVASDFGYEPDGSAAVGRTITGTADPETLRGSNADDVIRGLGGNDTLNGRGGNDVLEGGGGSDSLDGGLGNDILYGNNAANIGVDDYDYLSDDRGGDDQLFGQDGDDSLFVSRYNYTVIPASNVLLDGGSGNDTITFSAFGRFIDTVTVNGGSGNDIITTGTVLRSVIDAGTGNDKVTIGMSGGDQTVTLGEGADTLTLAGDASAIAIGAPTRVTDFQIGTDVLALDQYLSVVLLGWDRVSNPFDTGHLRLVQAGTDTRLQIDRDGAAGSSYGFATLLTLANTVAADFTARDLGYVPVIGNSTMLAEDNHIPDMLSMSHLQQHDYFMA